MERRLHGRAEEEPAVCPTAGTDPGDRLNGATAKPRDLLECALERSPGDPLPAVAPVDVEALDPPVHAAVATLAWLGATLRSRWTRWSVPGRILKPRGGD